MCRFAVLFLTSSALLASPTLAQAKDDKASRQIVVEEPAKEPSPGVAAQDAPPVPETNAVTEAPVAEKAGEEDKATAEPVVVEPPVEKVIVVEPPVEKEVVAPPVEQEVVVAPPIVLKRKDILIGLQTELKRVGCYDGAIDGAWGPASHDALEAFGRHDKVKSKDFDPSEGWLTLVKAETGKVCPDHARAVHKPSYRHRKDYGDDNGYGGGGYSGGGGY